MSDLPRRVETFTMARSCSRRRRRVQLVAGVCLVIAASAVAATQVLAAPQPSHSAARVRACKPLSGAFTITVCKNDFVNQAGRRVVLRGVNTEGTQYDCAQAGAGFYDDPTVAPGDYKTEIRAMKAWGINLVRVNLNEECWLGINGVPASTSKIGRNGYNAYANEMGGYVRALNAARIYAEIDLHLNAPGRELISDEGDMDAQNPLPAANSNRFWRSVAHYFVRDRAVIFGVFNEPFPPNAEVNGDTSIGWRCDLDGCTVPDYTNENSSEYGSVVPKRSYSGVGMRRLILDIRSIDRTTPILVGGPDFAGDLDHWLRYFYPKGISIDPDHRLAASVHIYFPPGNSPCSVTTNVSSACPRPDTAAILQVARDVPVLIDEVGSFNCASSDVFSFLRSVDSKDRTARVDVGYAGWAWTTYSCDPNLISSWKTGAPSSYGEAEYCELLDLRLAPRRNGLFAPSRYCAGAVPDARPR